MDRLVAALPGWDAFVTLRLSADFFANRVEHE
jgi:hypothetical protein